MTTQTKDKAKKEIELIVKEAQKYIKNFDRARLLNAFKYADEAHKGQVRKENIPYIHHPIEAVKILVSLHVDEDSLIAALLHDVPEDTEGTIEEIKEMFGDEIAYLVDGITKLSKVHYRHDMEGRQIESLKKLFIHSAKDPRVILIKLADRVHNMRTLQFIPKPEKRLRIARETLEIYVPIANLLGIDQIKTELEDLCLKFLFPKDSELIEKTYGEMKIKKENILKKTINKVNDELKENKLKEFQVTGREKAYYSIFKKTLRQGKKVDELEDIIALRILVDSLHDCYTTLGVIHMLFKPKPGRFKDYIAVPKNNGYQSLHTVVFGIGGQVTEFQIRTKSMHLDATYGIAAHYFYKENTGKILTKDKTSRWAQIILESQKELHENEEFLKNLKIDVFQDRIFTFTPTGDTIDLPRGATCIDFAYAIHTEVGNNALKAEINGEVVPLTTTLRTGDTLKVITSQKPKGPNRTWLFFAKTNLARNKIKDSLKTISKKKKVKIGRKLLQKEFDKIGLGLIEEISKRKKQESVASFLSYNCKNFEDIIVLVGEGVINPIDVVKRIYPQKIATVGEQSKFFAKLFGIPTKNKKRVELKITFIDRVGSAKAILQILSEHKINIAKMKGKKSLFKNTFTMKMIVDIESFEELSSILDELEHVEEIYEVSRAFRSKKIQFYFISMITVLVWLIHPILIINLEGKLATYIDPNYFRYGAILLLFWMVFMLKKLTKKSFPELRETGLLWLFTFLIGNFALITVIAEIYFYNFQINWLIVFGLVLIIYGYLIAEYIDFKKSFEKELET